VTPPTSLAYRFECTICVESSTAICTHCTKDACDNHICRKCHKCSDCCECEVPLNDDHPEHSY
jgi:hypothetical protein